MFDILFNFCLWFYRYVGWCDCEVKFVKELYLCEFFFCDCLKWELKRDIIGSLDCNEEKEIREMDRCFWDVSDEFGILD